MIVTVSKIEGYIVGIKIAKEKKVEKKRKEKKTMNNELIFFFENFPTYSRVIFTFAAMYSQSG